MNNHQALSNPKLISLVRSFFKVFEFVYKFHPLYISFVVFSGEKETTKIDFLIKNYFDLFLGSRCFQEKQKTVLELTFLKMHLEMVGTQEPVSQHRKEFRYQFLAEIYFLN